MAPPPEALGQSPEAAVPTWPRIRRGAGRRGAERGRVRAAPPRQSPGRAGRQASRRSTAVQDSPAMPRDIPAGLYRFPLLYPPLLTAPGFGFFYPDHDVSTLHALSRCSTPPPLDLSVKPAAPHASTPITPPTTPTPGPASPTRKRSCDKPVTPHNNNNNEDAANNNHAKGGAPGTPLSARKGKAVRRLAFDEDKSSPVSGTIIRDLEDAPAVVRQGDIDPAFNVVEVTDEAKAELAAIDNRIGDYVCRLCRELFADAFQLARHRCSCIVHVEYRCPDCEKVFNCPANLASHRRWHRPRAAPPEAPGQTTLAVSSDVADASANIPCPLCPKKFRRQAYLRKHLGTHATTEPSK